MGLGCQIFIQQLTENEFPFTSIKYGYSFLQCNYFSYPVRSCGEVFVDCGFLLNKMYPYYSESKP